MSAATQLCVKQLRCSVAMTTLAEQQLTTTTADFKACLVCRHSSHAALTPGSVLIYIGFVGYQEDPYPVPV